MNTSSTIENEGSISFIKDYIAMNVIIFSYIFKVLVEIKNRSNSEGTQKMVSDLFGFTSGNQELILTKVSAFLAGCIRDMTDIGTILPILVCPELSDTRNTQLLSVLVSALSKAKLISHSVQDNHVYVKCEIPDIPMNIKFTVPDNEVHVTNGILGNGILKRFNQGFNHCEDTLQILGSIDYEWNQEIWDLYPHMIILSSDSDDKKKSYKEYESHFEEVVDSIPEEGFHIPMKPDWRGRYYSQTDLGNFTGNKELRYLITFKEKEYVVPEFNLDVDDVDTSKFGI